MLFHLHRKRIVGNGVENRTLAARVWNPAAGPPAHRYVTLATILKTFALIIGTVMRGPEWDLVGRYGIEPCAFQLQIYSPSVATSY